jgi:hypothetical protein
LLDDAFEPADKTHERQDDIFRSPVERLSRLTPIRHAGTRHVCFSRVKDP